MVDDIHLTEEEQVERIKSWWKQNALSILLGVGGGLGLVFGYQYWNQQKITVAENASAEFQQVVDNASPNLEELSNISSRFKAEYANTPYAVKVALLSAKHAVENNALDSAATELQWVVGNADDEFTQHLARTRLANILVEQNQLEEAKKIITIADKGSFESSYYEVEGDIERLQKNFNAAKSAYEKALETLGNDPYAQVLQLRINKMNSLANAEAK